LAELLLVLAATLLVLGLHPYVTYPASLVLVPKRPLMRSGLSDVGPITLCFCAYNEERVLPEKIANLRRLKRRHPGLQVLAYVDGASDRSGEILAAERDLIDLDWSQVRHGKSHGMNRLVAHATSDIVVFTDANVILDETAFERLVPYFADPEVGCVGGHLRFVNAHASGAAATGSLLWALEEVLKRMESARGSVMGADGSLYAIRRNLHRPVPDDIIDDMYLSCSILCDGKRVVSADDVLAYEDSVSDGWEEFRRKIRIACQAYNVHRLVWPRLRKLGALTVYMYVSHRYLRWMMPFLLAGSMVAGVAGVALLLPMAWFGSLAVAAALSVGLAIAYGQREFTMLASIILSLAGVALGVIYSLRGDRFQTWEPATSIRRNR
jgi:cellulose synthase/poly-beta-1,6-N-acetylglucosamine synthase-like glycosyltransferase